MNIKSEIKQQSFASNYEMALINIIFTAQYLNDETNAALKKYGILRQHFNVLRIINGRGGDPVRPGEILEVMIDKGRDLTRLVDKLEKIGLVRREKKKDNKRVVHIFMTEKGSETLSSINADVHKALFANRTLTEDQATMLSEFLDKVRT